ncbi:MAG: hypothetical protein ACT4P3_12805 [Betaproteobacteria bacterium]
MKSPMPGTPKYLRKTTPGGSSQRGPPRKALEVVVVEGPLAEPGVAEHALDAVGHQPAERALHRAQHALPPRRAHPDGGAHLDEDADQQRKAAARRTDDEQRGRHHR